jgi:hypothetical protein
MPIDETIGRRTLDETPARVLTFLMGVGKSLPIRAALAQRGYTEKEHQTAWTVLQEVAQYSPPGNPTTVDIAVRDAVAALDLWDEPNFACIHATLARIHPDQDQFVFKGLESKQGAEAVLSVGTMLDRLDALESSPDRAPTREADHAALATLAARGYTPEERLRLRRLVKVAQTVTLGAAPIQDEDRRKSLLDLHAWLSDWSATARMVIQRRDHLILLGLSKRKKGRAGGRNETIPAAPSAGATPAPAGAPLTAPVVAAAPSPDVATVLVG